MADQIVVLERFEDAAGMPGLDDAGGLDALFAPTGTTAPAKERGPIGSAMVFSSGKALQASDLTIAATSLPRDLTIQAIMRWDFAAQNTLATPGTIIARGFGNSATEYMPFALELHVVDAPTLTGEVRFLWHSAAGSLKTEQGGAFFVPTGYFLLTATRHWNSLTSATIRYFINDQLLAQITTTDGDIASSTTGHTTIGARQIGGSYGNFLCGAIDELAISNYEMSPFEVKSIWSRISDHGPDGTRMINDLLPPGLPVSDNPTSRVQGDLGAMGTAIGFASGLIENMRHNMMPDQAYGAVLRQWEGITRQPPAQLDSLDTRRARVLAHLGSRTGVSVSAVQSALAGVLATAPANIQIIGFDDTVRDTFATFSTERWCAPNAGVDVIGNELRLQIANGAAARWDQAQLSGGIAALLPVQSRQSATLSAPSFSSVAVQVAIDIHSLGVNCEAGIVLWNWATNSLLFFGVQNNAGTITVGYQRIENGIAIDASPVSLGSGFTSVVNLRLRPGTGTVSQGHSRVAMAWNTLGLGTVPPFPDGESDWSGTEQSVLFQYNYDWMGVYARTLGTNTAPSAVDVRFGNLSAFRDLQGRAPFYWYAYRPTALGGAPDFIGANRVIQRMRHAFTTAYAISNTSLLADDPASVADGGAPGSL